MKISDSSMQDYVHYRLDQWADWYLRGNQYGLGYPKKNIMARLIDEGGILIKGTSHHSPSTNVQAEEIEMIVKSLAKQSQKLAEALRVQYFEQGTVPFKAKRMGLSYTQFKVHVDMAKQWVAGRLSA